MSTTHHDRFPATRGLSGMSRALKAALLMVALVGAFYLLREHWGHVAGNWVYLLLLACPLMHLFHGHGGMAGTVATARPPTSPPTARMNETMVMRPSHEGGGRAHQQTSSTPHCAGKKNKLVQSDTNIVFESTPDGIEAERLSC